MRKKANSTSFTSTYSNRRERAMGMNKSEAQAKLRELAREIGDFDLYDAAQDTDLAFSLLEKKFEDAATPIVEISGKQLTNKSCFKKNADRRKFLQRVIRKETNDEFKVLYEQELELIETYAFLALEYLFGEIATK